MRKMSQEWFEINFRGEIIHATSMHLALKLSEDMKSYVVRRISGKWLAAGSHNHSTPLAPRYVNNIHCSSKDEVLGFLNGYAVGRMEGVAEKEMLG